MIPILKNETSVLGFLSDALTCVVTEERNGVYELSMTYPVTGQCADLIEADKIILAKANENHADQMFRIYEVTKPISGIMTVNAEHISYELANYPLGRLSVKNSNPTIVIATILANAVRDKSYVTVQSPITTKNNFSCEPTTVRAALGGTEGSVLDVFGGEYEFDNRSIKLCKNRGVDRGVIVSYGKNLTDVSLLLSTESSYTALYPYAYRDDTLTTLSEKIINVPNTVLAEQKVLMRDFSGDFESDETVNQTTLRAKANAWLAANDINAPTISMTIAFQHTWESPEYAFLKDLEKVSLCDTVTVFHEGLGINLKAKVIKTIYNTLAERYEKLELGSAKSNFADTIKQTQKELKDIKTNNEALHSAISQEIEEAVDEATAAITGNSGGYVVLNPSEHPQELLVMNRSTITGATKLWRWNLSGLGYSSTGYSGTYRTAITMDGRINADFITTGTLTANIIRAGILTAVDGSAYFNVESGYFSTAYANITGGYISIGGSEYRTVIEDGSIKQHLTSSLYTGGLVPVGSSSTYTQCVYCSEQSSVEGVSLAQRNSNGTFSYIGFFGKSRIDLNKTTYINGGGLHVDNSIITNEAVGDTYTSVKHWRTRAFGGSGTSAYTVMAYFGIGNPAKKPSAALELKNYGDDSSLARLDIFRSDGEAYMCIRGSSIDGTSKLLELGAKCWWGGEMCATKFTVSSTEDIKENITETDSVLGLFKTSKIYKYNIIDEEPEPDPYDGDDEIIMSGKVAQFGSPAVVLDGEGEPETEGSIDSVDEPTQQESLGFVIGRETPQEVITDDGKHVDLYSMAAITWKAVQELLGRIEKLENKEES